MYLSNTRGYPLRWPILDHSPRWSNRSIPKIDLLAAATLSLSQPAACFPGHARQCVNGHSKDIMDRIRLLLLVDYVLVRESLSRQLRLEPDFEIVAECGTAAEGLEALSRSPVDVVLLDSEAVGDQAAQFISTARQAGHQGRFLVLASEKDTASLFMPLRAGASGVFRKHSSLDSLPRAIRQVAAGEAWVDLAVLQLLAGPIAERENRNLHSQLTKRERQVLEGVLDGLTNKAIAGQVGISEGAAKAVLREIFRKAGVRDAVNWSAWPSRGHREPQRNDVGQDSSSPAADVHVGWRVQGTRADRGSAPLIPGQIQRAEEVCHLHLRRVRPVRAVDTVALDGFGEALANRPFRRICRIRRAHHLA